MIKRLANSPMVLAADTKQIKYSPTSTPILDLLRPLRARPWARMNAGEYFFLSGAVILTLVGLPFLRRVAESLAARGPLVSVLMPCVFIPAAALLLSLGTHEGGHFIAAWLAGFACAGAERSSAGDSLKHGSEWHCDILRIASRSWEPRKLDHIRRRLFCLFAAGPAANLVLPVAAEIMAWLGSWGLLSSFCVHVFACVSALQGAADLLPDSGRGSFSDGSRMLMLLRSDAAAGRWLSIIEMLQVRSGENLLLWDEATIAGLTTIQDETRDAVAARWLAYQWATQRQDITTATRYLEEALEISYAAPRKLCGRLFFEAALFQAWFRDDAEKARSWAAQMHRPHGGALQQPRLSIALMWADGKLFDAWENLRDYLARIQQLPPSPAKNLAEKQAVEWKVQMESRMLTRAWRTIYSMSQEVEKSVSEASTSRV